MNNKNELTPRKKPTQQRSRQTVDAILEAAAQVLVEKGYAASTTNRIASRAGVSIGSLYQYFPNKDSIVMALLEDHLEEARQYVENFFAGDKKMGADPAEMLEEIVKALIGMHKRDPGLHRVLLEEAPHPDSLWARVLQIEENAALGMEVILKDRSDLRAGNPALAARLAVHLIESLTHWFVIYEPQGVGEDEFLKETVDLLCRYLFF